MASLAASAPRVVVRRAAARNRLLLAHTRRGFAGSSAARPQQLTAKDAADHLMASYGGKTTSRRQLIDPNQLQKLALTLGRPHLPGTGGGGGDIDVSDVAPPAGTPVPPAYHLVYFTPGGLESELGIDGTDTSFNAAAPFTRRMWAGGVMKWPPGGGEHPGIRVGDVVEERTSLLSAVPKKSRSAGEMVLVEVAKELWTPRGLAAVDQRSWVFRPQLNPDAEVTPPPLPPTSDLRGLSVTRDDDVHGECPFLISTTQPKKEKNTLRRLWQNRRLTRGATPAPPTQPRGTYPGPPSACSASRH